MAETKYRTCNLCEALCGLEIEVNNNQIISIKGDKKDVFSKGHICPKAVALKDIHEDPDRLKFPLRKRNNTWHQISWEEAIEFTANRLYELAGRYGPDAVAIYQGNPSVHNLGTMLFAPTFVRALKTKNRYSATSVDQLAHHLAAEYMFGHMSLIPIPDITRTDFWLIMGGNPLVSNGSLMTAPNVAGKLRDIQKRGGKVVVVDPRYTETAKKADQHLFIRPGTDVYLLIGMIQLIFEQHSIRLREMSELIEREQLRQIKEIMATFSLDEIAQITGISRASISSLTHDFIASERAVCYGRLGVSATQHGGLCHWAINTLNIITGNFDRPGGAMLTSPAVDVSKSRHGKQKFRRWRSRVRKLPEFGGELPSSTLAEDILSPGEGQIKALVTSCGNPVLSVPNGKRLDEAFSQLEFMVSIDIYLNETTRHADIILPPATGVETPHYGIAFHNLAVQNSAKFSEPTVSIEEGMKYDWEIYSALHNALSALREEEPARIIQLNAEEVLDLMLQSGSSGLTLKKLKEKPHGIHLGELESVIHHRIKTEDGKINLFPGEYHMPLKELTSEDEQVNGLLLIGRRQLRSNNSWLHNSYRMVKGRNRCTLLIHPDDASERGIENGAKVTVSSRVGSEIIETEISDEIMKGVVSIPHGWGHHRSNTRLSIASNHAGVSINDLLDEEEVDSFSGVSVINGIPVDVQLLEPQLS